MEQKVKIDLSSPPPAPTAGPPKAPPAPEPPPKPNPRVPKTPRREEPPLMEWLPLREGPPLMEEPPRREKSPLREEPPRREKSPLREEPPRREKSPAKAPKKPKKSAPFGRILILAGVAAAALFCIYRFVHFWSSPTCSQKESCILCGLERGEYGEHDWTHTGDCDAPAVCSICGRQQDQAAGHSWTGGSCTEPGVCGICGQTQEQPRGHLYVDGVCTDCGAEQEDRILRTWPNEGHNVESIWDPLEHSLEVRDASLHNFSKMDIVIRDYRKQALSDDRYTLARTDDSVKLNLPRDLEPGRYVLHAGVQETKVMDFWYGSCDSWMPEEADIWLSDFVLQSQAHGLYLTRSQEDIRLLGVPDPENAARFGTPWQICNVQYGADGSPQPVQGSQNQVFVVDTYVMHTQSADPYLLDQTTAHVLHYNGLHLAMDSAGTVYLTDTLDADCFWTISSGLQ